MFLKRAACTQFPSVGIPHPPPHPPRFLILVLFGCDSETAFLTCQTNNWSPGFDWDRGGAAAEGSTEVFARGHDVIGEVELKPSQELAESYRKDSWYMLYSVHKNGLVKPSGRIHVELEFTSHGGNAALQARTRVNTKQK